MFLSTCELDGSERFSKKKVELIHARVHGTCGRLTGPPPMGLNLVVLVSKKLNFFFLLSYRRNNIVLHDKIVVQIQFFFFFLSLDSGVWSLESGVWKDTKKGKLCKLPITTKKKKPYKKQRRKIAKKRPKKKNKYSKQ